MKRRGGVRMDGQMLVLEVDPAVAHRAIANLDRIKHVSGSRRLAKELRAAVRRYATYSKRGRPGSRVRPDAGPPRQV